ADRARLVVDSELEIRIAAEEAADATLHLQLGEAAEEARVGVHTQETLAVVLEVVVPDEQVLGESIEIECVTRDDLAIVIRLLAQFLEGHREACLAGPVVGEDKCDLLVEAAQVLCHGIEVRES